MGNKWILRQVNYFLFKMELLSSNDENMFRETDCACWKQCKTDKTCKKKKGKCIPNSAILDPDLIVGKCKNNCVCYKGALPEPVG